MKLSALSSVNNQTYVQKQQKQVHKNHTAQSYNNSFNLPDYKVSFGMARIDLQELKKDYEIKTKYLTPDDKGNIPAFYMEAEALSELLDEVDKLDYRAVLNLLETKNEKNGKSIIHDADLAKQKVVHEKLNKYPNKVLALMEMYIEPDNEGQLPAHTFTDAKQFELLRDTLNKSLLKKIYTTETKDEKAFPSHTYGVMKLDHLQAEVIKTFDDDKDTLKRIFLSADSDGDYPMLAGPASALEFIKVFKNDDNVLESYFLGKNKSEGSADEVILNGFYLPDNDFPKVLDTIHEQLIDSNPKILKELYTHNYNYREPISLTGEHAKRIMQLVTDSDLNEKDSLEVLKFNKEILKEYNVKDLNLIELYLEDKVRENKAISQK